VNSNQWTVFSWLRLRKSKQYKPAEPKILNRRGPISKCNDLHLLQGASWRDGKAPRTGVPIKGRRGVSHTVFRPRCRKNTSVKAPSPSLLLAPLIQGTLYLAFSALFRFLWASKENETTPSLQVYLPSGCWFGITKWSKIGLRSTRADQASGILICGTDQNHFRNSDFALPSKK
jgi:hypothetical protein